MTHRHEGERLKERGMALAAASRPKALEYARQLAREIALSSTSRECDADLVQAHLIAEGIDLGNAAGSIFRGSDWEFTGRFKKSDREIAHANLLRVWRLRT